MPQSRPTLAQNILGSSLLWGGLFSGAFYAAVFSGELPIHPLIVRYSAGHPVEYVTVVLFFVALIAQILKGFALFPQKAALKNVRLGEIPDGGQSVDQAKDLLEEIALLPQRLRNTYFVRRLEEGLEHVRRKHSADRLEEELKYWAEADSETRHASHAFVRVIIWAVPMLGFLGTVMGLTEAIANLSVDVSDATLSTVLTALGGAFDTTALSLALSMVLMFTQYWLDRSELSLLRRVDQRTQEELADRFTNLGTAGDPVLLGVRQMSDAVLQATAEVVQKQSQLWQDSLAEGQQRWQGMASEQQHQLETALSRALGENLKRHSEALSRSEQHFAEDNRRHWDSVQQALRETAGLMARQQQELTRQGEVLLKVVESTGQVAKLEEALNRNLSLLTSSRSFEETVQTLAAAINLLTAKLGGVPDSTRHVSLSQMPLGRSISPSGLSRPETQSELTHREHPRSETTHANRSHTEHNPADQTQADETGQVPPPHGWTPREGRLSQPAHAEGNHDPNDPWADSGQLGSDSDQAGENLLGKHPLGFWEREQPQSRSKQDGE